MAAEPNALTAGPDSGCWIPEQPLRVMVTNLRRPTSSSSLFNLGFTFFHVLKLESEGPLSTIYIMPLK
jgi:hypothetical protein